MDTPLASELMYERRKNDMHTVSIVAKGEYRRDAIASAIQDATLEYLLKNSNSTVRSTDVTVGCVHKSHFGHYVFAFVHDSVLFNLLVGKSEAGVDLYRKIYVCSDGSGDGDAEAEGGSDSKSSVRHLPDLPSNLSDLKLDMTDVLDETPKAKLLFSMLRKLDGHNMQDATVHREYMDPLIIPACKGETLKVVPVRYKVEVQSKKVPRVLFLPHHRNEVSYVNLQSILDCICVRESNIRLYLYGKVYSGTSPLVIEDESCMQLHFTSNMLTSMCYYMLNGFSHGDAESPKSIYCEFRHASSDSFTDVPRHSKRDGGMSRNCQRRSGSRGGRTQDNEATLQTSSRPNAGGDFDAMRRRLDARDRRDGDSFHHPQQPRLDGACSGGPRVGSRSSRPDGRCDIRKRSVGENGHRQSSGACSDNMEAFVSSGNKDRWRGEREYVSSSRGGGGGERGGRGGRRGRGRGRGRERKVTERVGFDGVGTHAHLRVCTHAHLRVCTRTLRSWKVKW